MYGRCETDPFDQATDVCDSCYGEFCAACMITTKGRKYPICKECAIIVSGVRPGAKPLLRGSKKTANKRRKALKDAPPAPRNFEYFDDAAAAEPAEEWANSVTSDQADDPPIVEAQNEVEVEVVDPPMPQTAPLPAVLAPADTEPTAAGVQSVESAASATPTPTPNHSPAIPPALAGPQPSSPSSSSSQSVSPGLAALAQHRAEQVGGNEEPDFSDVPAPDWGTEPVEADAGPWADPQTAVPATAPAPPPALAGPTQTAPTETSPAGDRRRDDTGAKPVTDGFDWVTQLPPRGSTGTLQPQTEESEDGAEAAAGTGAVATADRPPQLPRRRSTLRPPDNGGR